MDTGVGTDGGGAATDGGGASDSGTPPVDATTYAIGGTVSGLSGSGLVLQDNGGNDLPVTASGTFVFSNKLAKGAAFAVTVKSQPMAPVQTCTVSGGTGTVGSGNVTTVVVDCNNNKFTVGGSVSGLAGTGLVLQNNAGDDVTVSANGTFAFPTTISDAGAYAVTVKTQPSNLVQTCTVTSGSGTVAGADVTGVTVACTTSKFTVGGTVTGLHGTGLVLQNNAGDDLPVSADGSFSFPTSLTDGSNFAVTVKTAPSAPAQSCVVTGDSGKLAGANVTSVAITCDNSKFAIGGSVSGLAGSGLVLQNNLGDDLPLSANGAFAFQTSQDDLTAYSVTVKTQPTDRSQICTVSNGSGNVAAAAVTGISVTCVTNTFNVKGTVAGLAGSGLVLQDNAGDDLPISADGGFTFNTQVASGDGYLVTVLSNPTNKSQTCTVTNGTGNVGNGDVTGVMVSCVTNTYSVGGTAAGVKGTGLVLQDNAGDDLPVAADGTFTFNTALQSGQGYAVTVKTQPSGPNQNCVVTGDTGTVTAGNVTTVMVNCTTDQYTAGGTVSGLAGSGLVLQNNLGGDLAISANGTFAFAPQDDLTAYSVTVKQQPSNKTQVCTVTNGSGSLAGASVTNIGVSCVTSTFNIGGTVSGLTSSGLVLTDNGGDDLAVAANSAGFTFATKVASGSAYSVAVKTQPVGQVCSVTNGASTVTSSDVTSVTVTCVNDPCANYGGTRTVVNSHIRVCNTQMNWGSWDPSKFPSGWQVCNLTQWAAYAPSLSPVQAGVGNNYNNATIWINNNSCGAGQHHEVYYTYAMNDANCYNGNNCCWGDTSFGGLPIAICNP